MVKRLTAQAFTLTELLVAIGILAVLAAILLPVFFTARANGQRTVCASNLRQMAAASLMYAQDNDSFLPHTVSETNAATGEENQFVSWDEQIEPYAKDVSVLRCPVCALPDLGSDKSVRGYAFNYCVSSAKTETNVQAPVQEEEVRYPATTVLFTEVHYSQKWDKNNLHVLSKTSTSGPDIGSADDKAEGYQIIGLPGAVRHGGGSNYPFADGHVRWFRPENVKEGCANDLPSDQPNDGTRPSFAL